MKTKPVRQGDILFVPTEDTINPVKKLEDGVIAEGEATGHRHRIFEADLPFCELVEVDYRGSKMLKVTDHGISIVHDEHKPVTLEPGTYRIHQAREHDYLAGLSRPVWD
jgi:hypothetical protein